MSLAMRQKFFFLNSYKKLGAFQMQNVFIVKSKNGKANPFSNTNPNILGGFLGANININTNIDKNYLV
jgi:hypothetical protein